MKAIIKENNWLSRGLINFGWGNGYVLIPIGNKLHGKHYDELNNIGSLSVHGGLTYSELVDEEMIEAWELDKEDLGSWCVGFDTAHYSDTLEKWSKDKVRQETENLKIQLESI